MRYSKKHKEETHRRLTKLAGKALREKGPDRVSIVDVMKKAGLTHGGFYAHFKSKDVFLSETLIELFSESAAKLHGVVDGLPPRHALAAYIDYYVSSAHRDHRESGCPIVALNSDMPRQSKKFRTTFENGVNRLIGILAEWIDAIGLEDPEALAASILAAMAGAVALSRAVTDTTLSDELLASARENIKARLGVGDVSLSRKAVQ